MSASIVNNRPLYSVIIPIYNHGEFLPAAVNSVLNQTLTDWEMIIVNDGSTDNTQEIINEYVKKDSRIKGFYKENGGVSSALNMGIKNASGEFITWLSADDLFEPDKLEFHYDAAVKNPDKKFFVSMWYYLLEETQQKIEADLWVPLPKQEFRVLYKFYANFIHAISVSIHRSVFEDVGYFDEALIQGQDFDLWLRILLKYEFHFINKRGCTTRIHDGRTTNTFADGGIYDSTYSLIKNCSPLSFAEFFPQGFMNNYENAKSAVMEAISITLIDISFIHSLGYSSFLIDKVIDWLKNECPKSFRHKLIQYVKEIVRLIVRDEHPEEIKDILNKLLKPNYTSFKYDLVDRTLSYIKKFIDEGNQEKAISFERFLSRSYSLKQPIWEGKEKYQSILYEYWDRTISEPLNEVNIIDWNVTPNTRKLKFVDHILKVSCEKCGNDFNVKSSMLHDAEPAKVYFMCPKCKTKYEIGEDRFKPYIESKLLPVSNPKVAVNSRKNNRIAYLVKKTRFIGGGTKIVFKHIDWLEQLGINTILFSYDPKPDWTNLKTDFHQIVSINEIQNYNFDQIIAFSIFDIPELLKVVSREKVFLFCQGYEGYHYGQDPESMRADKFILTELHLLPFNTLAVSTHLQKFFKEKFNKDAYYIPNGIDLKTFFKPDINLSERNNSITFIGNPFHMLKGFSFLASTLEGIQKSKYKIENLVLNVVIGFEFEDIKGWKRQVEFATGAKVELFIKLNSNEVADLLSQTKLVVCTSIYEGFSLPLLEAMASGAPVITTSNMGAESFCRNGVNSFIINYNNHKAFAEKILTVFYRSEEVIPLVRNGFQTAIEYSEYNSIKKFVKEFETINGTQFDKTAVHRLLDKYYVEIPQDVNEQTQCDVSFIIPTYNNSKLLGECIDSLVKNTNTSYEIIVVDDYSSENIQDSLKKFEHLRIIRNDKNLGFPKSINNGLKQAKGKYLVLVNNDTLCTRGSIDRLIQHAESDHEIGLVGVMSNYAGGVQLVKNVPYRTVEQMRTFAESFSLKNKGQLRQYPSVSFLFTLIKREVVNKVGMLDERFSPGYFEDDDFCLRCQLAGYKTVIAEDVFIHHYGSSTFNTELSCEVNSIYQQNKNKFAEKWGGTPEEIWLQGKPITTQVPRSGQDSIAEGKKLETALRLLEEKNYSEALDILDELIIWLDKGNKTINNISLIEILNLTAEAALLCNNFEKAKTCYEKILNLNPKSVSACIGLAKTFIQKKMMDEAIVMLNWALKIEPKNLTAAGLMQSIQSNGSDSKELYDSIVKSESLINQNKLDEARELLIKILEKRPNNCDVLNNLSVVELLLKNYEKSLQYIQRVLTLNPSDEIAIGNLNYIENEINTLASS